MEAHHRATNNLNASETCITSKIEEQPKWQAWSDHKNRDYIANKVLNISRSRTLSAKDTQSRAELRLKIEYTSRIIGKYLTVFAPNNTVTPP